MFFYDMFDFFFSKFFFTLHVPTALLTYTCAHTCVCFIVSTGKVGDEQCAIIYPPNGELLSVIDCGAVASFAVLSFYFVDCHISSKQVLSLFMDFQCMVSSSHPSVLARCQNPCSQMSRFIRSYYQCRRGQRH